MTLKVGKIYKHTVNWPQAPWMNRVAIVKVTGMKIDHVGNGKEMYSFEPILLEYGDEFFYRGFTNEVSLDNFEEL